MSSSAEAANDNDPPAAVRPSASQRRWLERGLCQPGGKLPLFDETGRHVGERTMRSCISRGWAEPWFRNPLKPDWTVCRLTAAGRAVLGEPDRSAS
jgi:hypothetical protein